MRRDTNMNLRVIPSDFDFVCSVIWLLPEIAVLFLLVYLPPKGSPYVINPASLNRPIMEAKTAASGLVDPQTNIVTCLPEDFNLPNTQWSLMSSNCLHKTPYLNIFIGLDLYPINYQATHKAGNVLDNTLTTDNFSQLEVTIDYNLRINDHFPLLFQCFRDNSAHHADPV